jgi:hypothetical protein
VRSDARDFWMAGEIEDEAGRVLSTAEARWRRIG